MSLGPMRPDIEKTNTNDKEQGGKHVLSSGTILILCPQKYFCLHLIFMNHVETHCEHQCALRPCAGCK